MTNENQKPKLSKRIRGAENYYLNLTKGTEIEVCTPDGYIHLSIKCLSNNVVASKRQGDPGWRLQSPTASAGSIILGTPASEKFLKEAETGIKLTKVKAMFGKCPLCGQEYSDLLTHFFYDFCSADQEKQNELYEQLREQYDQKQMVFENDQAYFEVVLE